MLTAPRLNYSSWEMRDDYNSEPLLRVSQTQTAPLDFGSLDAPDSLPAGSHYSYQFYSRPGYFTSLPSSIHRDAVI